MWNIPFQSSDNPEVDDVDAGKRRDKKSKGVENSDKGGWRVDKAPWVDDYRYHYHDQGTTSYVNIFWPQRCKIHTSSDGILSNIDL